MVVTDDRRRQKLYSRFPDHKTAFTCAAKLCAWGLAAEVVDDRTIARKAGVHHSTVADHRAICKATGTVADSATRIGADGVEQPATKAPR